MKIFKSLTNFSVVIFIFFSVCSDSKDSNVGVISAGSPEAVSAGLQILKQGGNAVDASIAVAFALAVTEPAQSGLGGQAQFLIYKPGDEPIIINGTSFSPLNLPENISKQDLVKYKATTVPSMVKVLDYLWKNYSAGLEWSDLLNPSIGFAEEGFPLAEFRHKVLEFNQNELRKDPVTSELFLGKGGSLIKKDVSWKQPVLAKTLKQLAEKGAEDFYCGDIAKKIVEDMKINNGWITKDDLTNLANPKNQKPLRGTYRGYEIYTMPPPGGGWVIIQALNILEQYPSEKLKLESDDRLKLIAIALQIAHSSRSEEPVEDLINYQEDVNLKIDKNHAKKLIDDYSNGETTHFSVVDKNGMVVSATLSINNYFGSKAASPELGFLYNDYMNEFKLSEPGNPFNLRPDAMPYSSMTPTILMKDGKPVMAIGSPGSERIISAIVQFISLWIDAGLNLEDAVPYPRIHVTPDKTVYMESDNIPTTQKANLINSGFVFEQQPSEIIVKGLNPYFGGINAIAFENGEWKGAADPRRDGTAGYSH
ncbi:MAG: gamma-glutamyltransferase family protein [Ignavibacteriaceae bacterium]|nr:gamma-glutamyltransferase family protein [Ignavibacteriaceae bacterium]MCW8995875.1 gamma-glutamyltransferase family protein [Psychromonas sp.]